MHQTNHFFNLGYGWLCKHCSAEEAERRQRAQASQPHGHNAHRGAHQLTNLALAKWIDEERHGLTCPRCGIEELISRT